MTVQELVALTLAVSIALTVFGFGLRSTRDDLLYPLRHRGQLARALTAMFVVMPVVAIVLCAVTVLHPAVEIALVALAISPMPPLLTNRQATAGGRVSYGIGLMTVAALLSVGFIPLAVAIIGRILGLPIGMDPAALVRLAMVSVLLPLAAGVLVRIVSPSVALRAGRPVAMAGIAGLAISVAAILIVMLPTALVLIGNGTLLVFVLFVTVGLAVGHALGGPRREERVVLALSTACRHPAIAIAVARANFPEESLVPAAVLLYLLVNILLSGAYIVLQRQTAGSRTSAALL
jgi:BASS family bile acid:Na+ symporter